MFEFSGAIVRRPALSARGGLRSSDRGDPDVDRFRSEHEMYCSALAAAGVTVHRLPELEAYPDSVFVEDPALVLPEVAVLFRTAAQSRQGEAEYLADELEAFRPLAHLQDGHVDGGDLLVNGRDILVGLSLRTDTQGCSALAALLSHYGYRVNGIRLPPGLLHLKSGCSLLDAETVLVTDNLAETGIFADYRRIVVPRGEAEAANALRVNEIVLLSAGFPATADRVARHGYDIVCVETRQAAKLDGGLSCMSLRF